MKYKYKFTVIMPVYNVEEYVAESIESVIKQSIGFKNIQLILVNDGSKDDSERVCLEYQKKYPNNIKYIYQKNSGVSAARNNGMKYIEGKYVNFLDSDDKWTRNSFKCIWKFFEKNYDEIDVVACRLKFFDQKKGYQVLDYKFDKERIIDINTNYNDIILSAPSTIIKAETLSNITFDKKLKYGEDAVFINKIIIDKGCYGVTPKALYLYRKRIGENSAVDTATNSSHYYNESIDNYLTELKKYSEQRYGYFCKFFQALILYDIMWRFKATISTEILNNDSKKNAYFDKIVNLIKEIDDEVITSFPLLTARYKIYYLYLKYKKFNYNKLELRDEDLYYGDMLLAECPNNRISFRKVCVTDGFINLYGKVSFFLPIIGDNHIEIIDRVSGKKYNPKMFRVKNLDVFSSRGDILAYGYLFYLKLPVNKNYQLEFDVYLKDKYIKSEFTFLKGYNLSSKYKSYSVFDKKIIVDRYKECLRINKYNVITFIKRYIVCLFDLLRKFKLKTFAKKILKPAHKLYKNIKYLIKRKNIILFESNPVFTGNAKDVFDLMIKNGLNKKYKIVWFKKPDEEAPDVNIDNVEFLDYFELKKSQRSERVMDYFHRAKVIVDSNKYLHKFNSLQKRIHLNHGSPFKNAINYNISIGNVDYDICQSSFFKKTEANVRAIPEKKVIPLGFPRNDILYSKKDVKLKVLNKVKHNKIILWLPTYRNHASTATVKSGLKYGLSCIDNEKELINVNNQLIKDNVILLVKFHPAEKTDVLEKMNLSNMIFIKDEQLEAENISLYELFYMVDALITDYSSVYFDFCLTKKNIGLAISDYDDYIREVGEFQYPYKDVIKGSYMYNNKDLLKFINDVANDVDRTYKDRAKLIKKYDDYRDGKATERVYEFIKKFL